jgi:hypothetical protein
MRAALKRGLARLIAVLPCSIWPLASRLVRCLWRGVRGA